jgi:WD40 repeat protein
MATGKATGTPVLLPAAVTGLQVAMRNGSPVAVVGCADNAIRVVDLRTGTVGPVMTGHRSGIRQLVVVDDGARTVVVTEAGAGSSASSEIRFWDLANGAPVGPVLRDHPARGQLLTTARVGGRSLLIATDATADNLGFVAAWDLAALLGGSGS